MQTVGTLNCRLPTLTALRHPLRLALDAGDFPGGARHRQAGVAVDAHHHFLMVTVIDELHLTVADWTGLEHIVGLGRRPLGIGEST